MSWFSSQWNRWSSPNGSDGSSPSKKGGPIRRIEVVWGRERLQIVLPRLAEPLTLGHLRQEIASITSLPFEKIKLIHRGLVLKDDRLPLTSYGLSDGSRIGLVGSRDEGDKPGAKVSSGALSVGEQRAREKKAKESDTSEQGLLNRITEALEHSRKELFPAVERVERAVERVEKGEEEVEEGELKKEGVQDQHKVLSELLLRQLLALDGVGVNSDTTRQARKVAVKEVQGYLDRLDAAWNRFKGLQGQ